MKDSISNKDKLYWNGFDYFKGLLILCVFLGHIIPGEINDTYPRYLIYSFHMPLFIGISGFLLNIEHLDIRFIPLVKKYWIRMLRPWVIAVFTFFFLGNISNLKMISIKKLIWAYVHPQYHLWYILGFISYLLISCILYNLFLKFKNSKWILIIFISLIISCISRWNILENIFHINLFNQIYEIAHYDFRMYNLIYFTFGIFCRYLFEHKKTLCSKYVLDSIRILGITLAIIVSILFFFNCEHIYNILTYCMNICLLIALFNDCTNNLVPRSTIIEFLGHYSLPIYLYHVLCKKFALFVSPEGSATYYIVSILSFILGCLFIFFIKRIPIIDTILFGSNHKRPEK